MTPLRSLATALVLALLLPGFAAAAPPCAMKACEMEMTAGDHDCCPPAPAALDTPCCEQSHAAPATPARSAERSDAGPLATAASSATFAVLPPRPLASAHAPATGCLQPLDRLALGCVLRI